MVLKAGMLQPLHPVWVFAGYSLHPCSESRPVLELYNKISMLLCEFKMKVTWTNTALIRKSRDLNYKENTQKNTHTMW